MNLKQSQQFNVIHQENVRLIEAIAQIYLKLWVEASRPFKEQTELMKHVWTRIAGAVDRCNAIFAGKE